MIIANVIIGGICNLVMWWVLTKGTFSGPAIPLLMLSTFPAAMLGILMIPVAALLLYLTRKEWA